jgi:hypothetical protein
MAAPTLTNRSFSGSFSGPLPTTGSGSSGTPLPAGGRANPISLRIYKALGTSFDDPGSREALEIASSFYAPVGAQSPGKEKGKAKADRGDEDSVTESVDPLVQRRTLRAPLGTTGRTSTAAMARTQLKRDVETKLATGSQKFLEAFGEVDKVSRGSRVITSPRKGERNSPAAVYHSDRYVCKVERRQRVSSYKGSFTEADCHAETRRATRSHAGNAGPMRPSPSGAGSSQLGHKISPRAGRRSAQPAVGRAAVLHSLCGRSDSSIGLLLS